jgi:large subunit ribosomal protein L32e
MNELLKIRKMLKTKKPHFLRQEFDRGTKLEHKWVKPRGRTNKMRSCLRGQRKMPSIGYSSPKLIKGTLPSGEKIVFISNVHDLEKIVKTDAAIVKNNVGARKKIQIIEAAKVKGIKLYNIKEGDKFAEKIKKQKEERKKQTYDKKEKREKMKEEAEKKIDNKDGKNELVK